VSQLETPVYFVPACLGRFNISRKLDSRVRLPQRLAAAVEVNQPVRMHFFVIEQHEKIIGAP